MPNAFDYRRASPSPYRFPIGVPVMQTVSRPPHRRTATPP
jgi:hypothetical protein